MRICICFYGVIGRSLKQTFPSIKTNIFDVLTENKIEFDVYLHNNCINVLRSTRAGETAQQIDNECWRMLEPVEYISEDQDKAPTNAERFDKEFAHIPDKYDDNKQSYKFALYEMYSCKKVTELWKGKKPYDCYLYLRPDLEYLHKIDLQFIKSCMARSDWNNTIATPCWHNHADEGLNDRIAFGSYDSILVWGERFDYIDEFLSTVEADYKTTTLRQHFVAELFTYWAIVEKMGITNIHILGEKTKRFPDGSPFWARRVRAGHVHAPDMKEFNNE